jgi:hypothetical protein
MRKIVYKVLKDNAEFMALLPGGLYGDRALEGTPSAKPFAVLTFEGPTPGVGRHLRGRAYLWIHDNVGDFTRIDSVHKAARDLLESLPPIAFAGEWLTLAEWEGNSTDLFDDARGTNVKSAGYLLIGSGL